MHLVYVSSLIPCVFQFLISCFRTIYYLLKHYFVIIHLDSIFHFGPLSFHMQHDTFELRRVGSVCVNLRTTQK